MAAAWLDEREPELVHLARGAGRPLWLGEGRDEVLFASTKLALEVAEEYCELRLRKREVHEGTAVVLSAGKVVRRESFRVAEFEEPDPLPAVRAAHEGRFCLTRLAAIAAAV